VVQATAEGALTTGNTGLQVDPLVNRAFREGLPPAPKPGRADEPVQDAMNQTAKNFNQILPDGISPP
jgi:hypothetical protein